MLTKCNLGNSFEKTINYLTQPEKRWEIIKSEGLNTCTPESIITDFQIQAESNSRVKSKMLHISLNHHPNDRGISREKEISILDDWLAEMKQKGFDFESTQYAIIRHDDRKHLHYHLVANKVNNNGKGFNDSFIGIKAKDASKKITKRYGLTPANEQERGTRQETERPEETREAPEEQENKSIRRRGRV